MKNQLLMMTLTLAFSGPIFANSSVRPTQICGKILKADFGGFGIVGNYGYILDNPSQPKSVVSDNQSVTIEMDKYANTQIDVCLIGTPVGDSVLLVTSIKPQ